MNAHYLVATLAITLATPALAQKQLLWGDTHLHTTYSSDALANNNLRADPESAFRYASGLPTIHPYHQARVQIETPLDFLVVSDHAEFLGVIRNVYFEGVDTSDVGFIDGIKGDIAAWILQRAVDKGEGRSLFVDVLPDAEDPQAAAQRILDEGVPVGWLPPQPQVEIDTWNTITGFADKYNKRSLIHI